MEDAVLAAGSEAGWDFNSKWDLTGLWAYRRPGFGGPVVFMPVSPGGSWPSAMPNAAKLDEAL